jgi:hypothetical protein
LDLDTRVIVLEAVRTSNRDVQMFEAQFFGLDYRVLGRDVYLLVFGVKEIHNSA